MVQIILTAGLLVLVLPHLGALAALIFTLGVATALVAANLWLYAAKGLVLPLASALLLTALVNAGTTAWGYVAEGHTRRALAKLFGSYVPPELVTEMGARPRTLRHARREPRAQHHVLRHAQLHPCV